MHKPVQVQFSAPGEEFFRALEERRTRALVQRDLEALEELHAPEYQLITPAGRVFTRDSYLGTVRAAPFYVAWEVLGDARRCRLPRRLLVVQMPGRLSRLSQGE